MKFYLAVLVILSFAIYTNARPAVYIASVRWVDDLPFFVNVVVSTMDDQTGQVNDIATLLSGEWSENVYYPCYRYSSLSQDGSTYYYVIMNPIYLVTTLYVLDIKSANVSVVTLPHMISGGNGQAIHSIDSVSKNLLLGVYGNMLVYLDPTTGKVLNKVQMWQNTDNLNSTTVSYYDFTSGNLYVQGKNHIDTKPCQFTFTINVQSQKVSKSPCLRDDHGTKLRINQMASWNSTWMITLANDILGGSIILYNPTTAEWGNVIFGWEDFGTAGWLYINNDDGPQTVYDPTFNYYYMLVAPMSSTDPNPYYLARVDAQNGQPLGQVIPSVDQTWECMENIPH